VTASDEPASPLRVFGRMLRYYRVKAGISQADLGSRVFCSADLISKIEKGQRAPTQDFAVACDGVPELNTGGSLTELREQLRDYLRQQVYPGWFHRWPEAESQARALRWYEQLLVPGLLQTGTTPTRSCAEPSPTWTTSGSPTRWPRGYSARKPWRRRTRHTCGASLTRVCCTAASVAAK
jgi:transcriptional regulator with XRE-family HTH domain